MMPVAIKLSINQSIKAALRPRLAI